MNDTTSFEASSVAYVDIPGSHHSQDVGDKTLQGRRTPRSPVIRRNAAPVSPNRQFSSHRRYKSYSAYSQVPISIPPGVCLPTSVGTPRASSFSGQNEEDNGQYYHQLPLYNPWLVGHPASSSSSSSSAYDMQWSVYRMHVFNTIMSKRSEEPTRVIYIGNLPPSIEEKYVIDLAQNYGTLRGVDAALREFWCGIFVSYWDSRHAEEAVRSLPEIILSEAGTEDGQQRVPITVCFMQPPEIAGMENQGTIEVKTADGVTINEVHKIAAKFGEVKTIGNLKDDVKTVVEYYDARAAEAACCQINTPKFPEILIDAKFTKLNSHSSDKSLSVNPEVETIPPPPPPPPHHHGHTAPWLGSYLTHPWTQYAAPQQNYVPKGRLHRQNSAPAAAGSYGDHQGYPVRHTDAVWAGHYMSYPPPPPPPHPHGLQLWSFAGNHPAPPVALMPVSSRFEGHRTGVHRVDGSPVFDVHGSETGSWRPHKTRSAGERVYDPAQFQFNLAEATSDPSGARTTLMIRNIPNKYSQKMLLDVLKKGYNGRFDFFYLPIDFKNRCNLGYAFVNFVDAATTVEFYQEFHTKSWEEFNSKKVCEITYARVQGRESLIEHFRNSRFPCNDPDYLPLVFDIEDESKNVASDGTPIHNSTADYTETSQSAVAAH
eukprot:g2207.t1